MKKTYLFILTLMLSLLFCPTKLKANNDITPNYNISVPFAGNAWVLENNTFIRSGILTKEGIQKWTDPNHVIRCYFFIGQAGTISLGIKAKAESGSSVIRVSFQDKSKDISVQSTEFVNIAVGDIRIPQAGYYFLEFRGLEKSGNTYAELKDLLINSQTPETVHYVKDEFYYGRRGPSCHLFYEIPPELDKVEWFYSELLIPEGEDVIGTYFMAGGFNEGYFGIQVNSETERRILFSVWSPYTTDNPNEIPDEYKVRMIKKGKGVTTGKFGNEGSGGQSYKVFNWKAGVRYGFFVGAKPNTDGSTDYTAYFLDPEEEYLQLIAQFRRPKTQTYLKGMYSFIENFIPDQGAITRKGFYANQWVYANGKWHEINKAKFTADAAARKKYRLDYTGGAEGDMFRLKNCGFIYEPRAIGSIFTRQYTGKFPQFKLPESE